jgi:hypothetical protein
MKLMVEVQLDWLDEGGKVDSVVKDEIVSMVAGRIDEESMEAMKSEAAETISRQVDKRINDLLNEFLDRPVVVTDNYGDKIAEHESVLEMIKDRFDKFMTQVVDQYGKPTAGCGHGKSPTTRLDWMLDQRINSRAEEISKGIVDQVESKIKTSVNDAVKSKITDTLLKKIDLAGAIAGKA